MRCLAGLIARRGNNDEHVSGRFWKGRLRARMLPDETGIAACMAHVDLNPVRAGIAESRQAFRAICRKLRASVKTYS